MPEVLEELVVKIGADLTELKGALVETQKNTKKVAKAMSITGIAARKAMLTMANSSVIANMVMGQFNAMIGVIADTIFMQLMPVIQPILDMMWEMTTAFTNLDDKHKMVVAAITGIAIAMYLVSAHPIIAAIVGIIVLLALMRKHWDKVTAGVNAFLSPLKALWNIFSKIDDVLWGHSLIPALEFMANVIKTVLMPQMMILQGALKGVQMLISGLSSMASTLVSGFTTAGTQITQSFTQVFNFLGTGLTEFQEKAKDALGGLGSKIKSGLGF